MLLATAAAALLSVLSVVWVYTHGFTLYWGDAEAHLNIARRIVDARHTGYEQLGIPWLPLTHVLMLPFVRIDALWRSGLAGSIPCAFCFTIAAVFLFAATRRVLGSSSAWCAMALLMLNPNALYVQSIPMMEGPFIAAFMGILFFTTRYRDTQSLTDLVAAALMCLAASLTRYEGWILLPFVTLYVFFSTKRSRIPKVLSFGLMISMGVAWWLFYNWWQTGNVLYFYNGEGSASAIQAGRPYPGHGDWLLAIQYYFTAAKLVTGLPLLALGGLGVLAALLRRALWPVMFLAIWPLFIVWSMHSSAQPIHVPTLWPHSWYNTRYALAILPLLAFGTSALAHRQKALVTLAIILAGAGFWIFHVDHENWICWKESEQNSIARRAWTHAAASYLATHAKPTDTFFSTFGDISGVFRDAGIHFARTLTWDDSPDWQAAVNRPDLFLWEDWAVAQLNDDVDNTIERARILGVRYDRVTEIVVPAQPRLKFINAMNIPFIKAHGAKNDFLLTWLADAPACESQLPEIAVDICHRYTGVGADGWMLVDPTAGDGFDASIRLFNSDGSEPELSGNGTRCAAALLIEHGHTKEEIRIRTGAGIKHLKLLGHECSAFQFEMNMGVPRVVALRKILELSTGSREATLIDVGNPQCAYVVEDFDFDWRTAGAETERHPIFPNRSNVSFIRRVGTNKIDVRFFERGAGETNSSGTGSTGAAVTAISLGLAVSPVTVLTPAGALVLAWSGPETPVYLTGPAQIVAEGTYRHETIAKA